jgi:hypothetical protein
MRRFVYWRGALAGSGVPAHSSAEFFAAFFDADTAEVSGLEARRGSGFLFAAGKSLYSSTYGAMV